MLNDIRTQSRIQPGEIKEIDEGVDCLYARILFESIQHSKPDERNDAKRILATVVLAKEPLRKCDLVELLSTNTSDSSDVLETIESTLWELSPIIPVSDANDELRVCHKTVSDFLLSHDRSVAAMKRVVESWNSDHRQKKWDLDTSISDLVLDYEEENRSLALACVHLWRRSFMSDIHDVAELVHQANGSLYYASQHWLEHLEGAGGSRIRNLECLADAMELAYGRLQRYAPQMMLAAEAASAFTARLRDAADFASQCIDEVQVSDGNIFCSSEENSCLIYGTLSYRATYC